MIYKTRRSYIFGQKQETCVVTNPTLRQEGDSKEGGLSMVWLSMSFLHSNESVLYIKISLLLEKNAS